MKKRLLLTLVLALSVMESSKVIADLPLLDQQQDLHIHVNNKILVKVNGKAISVIDLMKKMDLQFYKQFPQYSTSVPARYQFYQANWKATLDELIDKELVLIDAEEMKLAISPGDVRQEMESMFGPNIIINLDKAGLTFDEAYKMVLEDITLRRMLYFRVQLQVISQVTPLKIRQYYDEIAKDNIRDNEWVYSVVTIRHKDPTKGAESANLTYNLLSEDKIPLDQLAKKIEEMDLPFLKNQSISISEEYKTKEKELSDNYKQELVKLSPETYSKPITQKSRSDNSSVFRIFYLKNVNLGGMIPYQELEAKIKNRLINEGVSIETDKYFKKQRLHFDIQEVQLQNLLDSDFQPFTLENG